MNEPDVGVRGSSVLNLEKDLARSLGVSAIRVVETIPGKNLHGLRIAQSQTPNDTFERNFAAPEFQNSTSKLTLGLGQDITGKTCGNRFGKCTAYTGGRDNRLG